MPEETDIGRPKMTIAVIAIGDATEALAIRAILENLGALVILHLPGTPDAFLSAPDDKTGDPRFVVISGHGTENCLHFGQYAPELKIEGLVDGCQRRAQRSLVAPI